MTIVGFGIILIIIGLVIGYWYCMAYSKKKKRRRKNTKTIIIRSKDGEDE